MIPLAGSPLGPGALPPITGGDAGPSSAGQSGFNLTFGSAFTVGGSGEVEARPVTGTSPAGAAGLGLGGMGALALAAVAVVVALVRR